MINEHVTRHDTDTHPCSSTHPGHDGWIKRPVNHAAYSFHTLQEPIKPGEFCIDINLNDKYWNDDFQTYFDEGWVDEDTQAIVAQFYILDKI